MPVYRFAALAAMLFAALAQAQTAEKVTFATNWKAQAEHGGYYQALADGTYKQCGLDVRIQMGGPSANNRPLLAVGKIDFLMGGNMLQAFDSVKQKIPTTVVAAHFQKDPQGIIAHPEAAYAKFEDLKKAPVIMISAYSLAGFYQWMKSQYGFKEEQVKPYNFSIAPFLVNKTWAQQGLLSSEPYSIEKEAKFKPKFFLLADYGWSTYSNTVETRNDLIEKKPKTVQCFVDASAIGWTNYLYGNNKAANEMIKKANPEMTDDLIAYSIAKIKEYGIVDSGDAAAKGIGMMTDARMQDFLDKMVKAGLFKPGEIDLKKVYTLKFTGSGAGMAEKKKLTGK
ncbi:MAG TPA: ABC transporter substrate-binding protein [Burkholderiales bacterium]|jgi:NitT/TauT family transport system substrate-binding protein|nr:ABC transporter substrate-binding protein [Burkholderiales bacterium]